MKLVKKYVIRREDALKLWDLALRILARYDVVKEWSTDILYAPFPLELLFRLSLKIPFPFHIPIFWLRRALEYRDKVVVYIILEIREK